jgi:hypothetical protein
VQAAPPAIVAAPPDRSRAAYTSGQLARRGTCLVLENVDGTLLPIWPNGTQINEQSVTIPGAGSPLQIGGRVSIEGRYIFVHDGSLQRAAGADAARCAQRGMIVEKASRLYMPSSAVEAAAQSDAVLVLKIDQANTADPRADAFKTTLDATVVEPLSGPYRKGDKLRLRHAYGQGSPILAHPVMIPAVGETVLLFVQQDFYRQQAQARGGAPLPGFVGAGGGMYRIVDGRILSPGDLQMPATLDELRRQLVRR